MISDTIINTLKPFQQNPPAANNMIYQTIANGISQYVTSLFSKCLYLTTGVVSLGLFNSPFAATCLSPMTPTFVLPEYRVRKAMTLGKGELIWPQLFSNIGSHMEIVYKAWKCIPAIIAFPVCTFTTAHFAAVGTEFYNALQKLDSKVLYNSKVDGTKRIWDMFELYLHKAIVTIPPVVVQVTGMVGIMFFSGAGTVVFSTL